MDDIEARLWPKIEKTPSCWLWTGSKNSAGYGLFWRGGPRLAHRIMYERFVGPIPEGLQLDHLCRNRACVNPAHLEPVTLRENLMRGESFSAVNAAKTHCPSGHPYDAENTYVSRGGGRFCRTCASDRSRRYRAQRALARRS